MKIKKIIKNSLKKTVIISGISFPVFLVMVKLGFKKWRASSEPISWEIFWFSLPENIALYLVGCLVLFVTFFVISFISKGNDELYICVDCEETSQKWQVYKNDGKCLYCGSRTEPLEGFYERHPAKKA
jgi:hypothetical protein